MTWLIHTSSQPSSDEAGKNGIARRRTRKTIIQSSTCLSPNRLVRRLNGPEFILLILQQA